MTIYRILNKNGKAKSPAFQYASQARRYLEDKLGNSQYLTIVKVK